MSEPAMVESTLKDFGNALRAQREKFKLSVRHCANQAMTDPAGYEAIERGEKVITSTGFKRIAALFPPLRHFQPGLALMRQLPLLPSTPSKRSFPHALRDERKRARLSQEEVAQLVGVTAQAVTFWEMGENAPIQAHYAKLLDLFPELRKALPPPSQDIDKPVGRGLLTIVPDAPPASSKPPSSAPLAPLTEVPPPTPTQPSAPEPDMPLPMPVTPLTSLSAALMWLEVLRAVKASSDFASFEKLLRAAQNDGISVADLIGALEQT